MAVVHLLSQRCDLNFCVQICFSAMLHTVVVRIMSVTIKLRCRTDSVLQAVDVGRVYPIHRAFGVYLQYALLKPVFCDTEC